MNGKNSEKGPEFPVDYFAPRIQRSGNSPCTAAAKWKARQYICLSLLQSPLLG